MTKWILPFGVFLAFACTNIEFDQTKARYNDNMSGGLNSHSDVSISDPSNFTFAALGDTHIGSPQGTVMKRALSMSKADGDAFAIVAGDITNTGIEAELQGFNAQVAETGQTVLPAIGNHDIFFGGWARYKTIIGRSIYSVNAGNAHLVFLDTANGTFGEDQLKWLKADLEANTRPIKVIVMHFPIFAGEISTIFKISSDEEANIFKNIMRDYSVQLVISGHYHGYREARINHTTYIVTGACNGILDIGETTHYVKVTIQGGTITTRQIQLN